MPERLWTVNASPIISLANIGHAHLLLESCDRMIIPRAVEQEILDGSDDDLAKHWISTAGRQWVRDTEPVTPGAGSVLRAAGRGVGYAGMRVIAWNIIKLIPWKVSTY